MLPDTIAPVPAFRMNGEVQVYHAWHSDQNCFSFQFRAIEHRALFLHFAPGIGSLPFHVIGSVDICVVAIAPTSIRRWGYACVRYPSHSKGITLVNQVGPSA